MIISFDFVYVCRLKFLENLKDEGLGLHETAFGLEEATVSTCLESVGFLLTFIKKISV